MSLRKTQLVKQILIYSAGEFGSKIINFILIPFYTMYLTTSEYGIFDLIITTKDLIIPIIYLQITDGIYRFLLDKKNYKTKDIISTGMYFIICVVIINVLGIIIGFNYLNVDIKYFYLIIAMYAQNILSDIFKETLRGLGKIKIYSISGIMTTVLAGSFNIYFIAIKKMSYEGVILANLIAYAITNVFMFTFGKFKNYLSIKNISKEILVSLLKYSLPLLPGVISWWIMNASDRYIIKFYLGYSSLGVYALSNKFTSILVLVNSIFYKAWQTSAIEQFTSQTRDEYYSEMFNYLMKIQILAVLIMTITIRPVLNILINNNYQESWKYVPILCIGVMFWSFSNFYGTSYLIAKKTIGASYTTLIGAVINITINIILIPFIGIYAASISTMFAYLVLWLIRMHTASKYFSVDVNYKELVNATLLITLAIGANYLSNFYFTITIDSIIIISIIAMYKDVILKGFKYGKKITCKALKRSC